MTEHGYITLSRKLVAGADPWWAGGEPFDCRSAWIDVLFMAQWDSGRRFPAGVSVVLARGEFVGSVRFLADRWRWSVKRARGWLEQAERYERIRALRRAHEGAHAPTVYLVVNYAQYQRAGTQKGTQKGTRRAHEGHTKGHTKGTRRGTRTDRLSRCELCAIPTRGHTEGHTEGHTKGHTKGTQKGTKKMKEELNKRTTTADAAAFALAWGAYPARPNNSKAKALRAWTARIREGVDPAAILAGVEAYAAYVARQQTAPEFVKQAATFFGPDRHWETSYLRPPTPVQVYDEVTGEMTPEFARAVGRA